MPKKVSQLLIVIGALLLASCTTHPIYNVSEAPVVASKAVSMDDVSKAIIRAGTGLGWQMMPDRPGHMVGRIALRAHAAVVDIDYSPKSYSIKYKDSTNLDYSGSSIHRNYNGWVTNLDKAIKSQLAAL